MTSRRLTTFAAMLLMAASSAPIHSAAQADGDGVPPVMAAVLAGDAARLEAVLKAGADPNATDATGATALHWSAHDVEKVRLLLAGGARVDARTNTGRTPLLVAAAYPRTRASIRLLLGRGADVRAQDQGGATALALALRSSDLDVVRLFVERGLDPNALPVEVRRTVAGRNDPDIVRWLLTTTTAADELLALRASMWQPADVIAQLLARGASATAAMPPAQYGRTPLLTAVTSEAATARTLEVLLAAGADPNSRMSEGDTALDLAIYKGDRDKIAVLERHGGTRGDGPRRAPIPPPVGSGAADVRAAVSRSLTRLTETAPGFREKAGCISCHHNALPPMAAAAARRNGVAVDADAVNDTLGDLVTFFRANASRMMQGESAVGGDAMSVGYALLALAANDQPADATTATMVHWLLARQMDDGRWPGNANRPPSEYSNISHTALAAGGLRAYRLRGRAAETETALARARRWLVAARAGSAEERAMRLMGLVWTNAADRDRRGAIDAIRRTQEGGGGWSQFGRTEADAYATGISLHALHAAGVPAADAAYRRGVAFLLGTQYPDGTWLVRSHAFPVQRYFESGFPFGRHQWISTAGTSWATLALAHTLQAGAERSETPP